MARTEQTERTQFPDRTPMGKVVFVALAAAAGIIGWLVGQLIPVPALGPGFVIALIVVWLVVERLRKKR